MLSGAELGEAGAFALAGVGLFSIRARSAARRRRRNAPVNYAGGVGFLAATVGFARRHSLTEARRVLRASLIYLPALLALLLLDGLSAPLALALRP